MKKLLLALAALLGLTSASYAQVPTAIARTTCGSQSLTAGRYFPLALDLTGNLCTSGSGGGGGGGAVTVADGADVTQGAKADAAWSGTGSGSVVALLKAIYGAIIGPIAAGSNVIGGVTVADGSDVTLGAKADAAYAGSGNASVVAGLKGIYAATVAALPAGTNSIGTIGSIGSQYPTGSVPITISATGTTGATTATLAASVSIHTFICGFSIRANATAAATGNATVTGTVTGTLNFTQWTAPNTTGLGINEQVFMPCITSSAINTGIAVISAAPGSGGVVSVSAWGYQL